MAGYGTIVSGTVTYRAYDLTSGGTLWLPVHMLADEAGNQISKTNPLAVGGSYPVGVAGQIASGQNLSASINLEQRSLGAIYFPGGWTSAAPLTFQASHDGTAFADVLDADVERSYVVTTGKVMLINPNDWGAVRYLKLRSGTSAAAVNQGANRDFVLVGVA